MLEVYLKTITAFSVLVVVFGFFYSDILLQLYGLRDLTVGDASRLMRFYWLYVLFMAVNGVSEAFVFSAMSKAEVDRWVWKSDHNRSKNHLEFFIDWSTYLLIDWFIDWLLIDLSIDCWSIDRLIDWLIDWSIDWLIVFSLYAFSMYLSYFRYNQKLVGFSAAFLLSSWGFVKCFGPVGFILANSLNFALRIWHSVVFIRRYYKNAPHDPLRGILVNKIFFLACTAVVLALLFLRYGVDLNLATVFGRLLFIGVGAVMGVVLLLVLWTTERELIVFLRGLFRPKEARDD